MGIKHAEGCKWEVHDWEKMEPSDCMKNCLTCESANRCFMEHCNQTTPSNTCDQGPKPPTQECLNCQMSDDAKNCHQCIMGCMEAEGRPTFTGLVLSAAKR